MSLYQKYRPTTFNEMMGNDAVKNMLHNLLENGQIKDKDNHYMIFKGKSGTGKTTACRILANYICKHPKYNIHEINMSGADRGIDGAKELINKVKLKGYLGDNVVYILDEVDQATIDWQKAMKKVLEDTPNHVWFLLCTTKIEKLIPDLKTRPLIFEFEDYTSRNLKRLLKKILSEENKELSTNKLDEIVNNSNGSYREAMNNLEKILLADVEYRELVKIGYESVEEGEINTLCKDLLNGVSWETIRPNLSNLSKSSEGVRIAIKRYMSSVLIKGWERNPAKLERASNIILNFQEPTYELADLVATIYELTK